MLHSKVVRLDRGDAIPIHDVRVGKYFFTVSLGAPYSAHQPESNPRHFEEVEFFTTLMQAQIPSLNICYSMQLFAIANGGKVEKNPKGKEVGVHEVRLTKDGQKDPVFGSAAPSFKTLQWHQDHVVELPKGSFRLAHSNKTRNQIAVVDRRHYLVQGDGQAADPKMLRLWIRKDHAFATEGTGVTAAQLLADLEPNREYFRYTAKRIFTNFTRLCESLKR